MIASPSRAVLPRLAACAPLLPTLRGDANNRWLICGAAGAHLVKVGSLSVCLELQGRDWGNPRHAAAEVLMSASLRLGVLDDAGTALKTVQPHAKTVVADARSRPDVCFLRCLAVDDGTAPTQLTVQNGEFVPQCSCRLLCPTGAPERVLPRWVSARPGARPQARPRKGFYEHPNRGKDSPDKRRARRSSSPCGRRAGRRARNTSGTSPSPEWASSRSSGRRRGTSGKDPKAVVCCYFLRDMCKNGDDCKFSHDRALAGGACSWGADCRYGHGKGSAQNECPPCADDA